MGDAFVNNLPHEYRGGEQQRAEQSYQDRQDDAFFWIPIAITDNRLGIRLPFSRSPVSGNLIGTEPQDPSVLTGTVFDLSDRCQL